MRTSYSKTCTTIMESSLNIEVASLERLRVNGVDLLGKWPQ